jgi:predicted metal-dependent HD superfamily phosphohydrolase
METKNHYQSKLVGVALFAGKMMPKLSYHNIVHALDVYSSASKLCALEKINSKDKFLIQTAALLHDIIYKFGRKDNEKRSAKCAEEILYSLNYSKKQIKRIKELILATKWPTNPKNIFEKIICDADLDNLGRKDFFKKSKKLLLEWGIKKDKNWEKRQLGLLENNKYYTASANRLREKGKKKNIERLKIILEEKK